jgi:hypothetical protein
MGDLSVAKTQATAPVATGPVATVPVATGPVATAQVATGPTNNMASFNCCNGQGTKVSTATGNPYRIGRLSTVDLLIEMGCFVKRKNIASV